MNYWWTSPGCRQAGIMVRLRPSTALGTGSPQVTFRASAISAFKKAEKKGVKPDKDEECRINVEKEADGK